MSVLKVLSASLLFGVTTTLVSCRPQRTELVAVIPRTTGILLWENLHEGVTEAAAEDHFRIYWNGPSVEDDVQRQIDLVDLAIQKRPAGIVLAPDHSLALISPVQRALRAGITVVIVDSPLLLRPQPGLFSVINDEEAAGELAARQIGLVLKGKGKVAVLGVDPNIAGLMERLGSFERHLALLYPGVTLVREEFGFFRPAQAQEAAREVLNSSPEINAIFALSAVATHGAVIELRQRQRTDVRVVGCDQDVTTSIDTRGIDALMIEDTHEMGRRAVHIVAERARGQTPPAEIKMKPALQRPAPSGNPVVQGGRP